MSRVQCWHAELQRAMHADTECVHIITFGQKEARSSRQLNAIEDLVHKGEIRQQKYAQPCGPIHKKGHG